MANTKIDLRVVKTKKAIRLAFIALIHTKGYERMTIQNIADEALINRNTFYLHYIDKVDLMEKLCIESTEQLNGCATLSVPAIEDITVSFFTTILTNTFEVIEKDITFYQAMLSDQGTPYFQHYLKNSFKDLMIVGLENYATDIQSNIAFEYMISGLVGAICTWILQKERVAVTSIVEQLSEIHCQNILNLLSKNGSFSNSVFE